MKNLEKIENELDDINVSIVAISMFVSKISDYVIENGDKRSKGIKDLKKSKQKLDEEIKAYLDENRP